MTFFSLAFVVAGVVFVDQSGARVERIADGRVVSVGKSWPGAFDLCVTDVGQSQLPNCYREPVSLDSIVKQPFSSGSAYAYTLIGLFILWLAGPSRDRPRGLEPAYQIWLGAIALAMGPGSILFHATLTTWGGWFDQMSMYGLLGFIAAYNVTSLKRATPRFFALLFVSTIVATGTVAALLGKQSLPFFIASAVGVALFELAVCVISPPALLAKRSKRLLGLALIILILALGPWLASGPSAGPPTQFPFHLLWHSMSAAFVGAYYIYLQAQKAVGESHRTPGLSETDNPTSSVS